MFYQNLAPVYRYVFPVGNKAGFLSKHLPETGDVLDVGSADGGVAAALESQRSDLNVIGLDLSEALLKEAKMLFPEMSEQFVECDMRDAKRTFGKDRFRGIYCIGNTLVHLEDVTDVILDFYQMLKPGGVLVIQILNYDKIMREKPNELPLIDNEQVTFERYYEYLDNCINFKSVLKLKGDGAKELSAQTTLYPLKKDDLITVLNNAGFHDFKYYSGFDGRPFSESDLTLIMKAIKPGAPHVPE